MDSTVVSDAQGGPLSTTEVCRYCWMCRHVCPVGHVTHRETFTPHAWALTIASVKRGALTWNAETADVLYSCADCGLCRAHCVTDRPLPDAIAAARAQVVAAGHAPAIVQELDAKLQAWGNPYGDRDALTPGLAGSGIADDDTPRPRQGDVALFVGDAAAYLTPTVLDAVRRLLAAAGLEAVPIGIGRSTGLLADTLGLADTARSLARAVIDEVTASGCRQLIVLSAADRYAFARVYPERLQAAWPEGVAITELSSLLADALQAGRLAFARPDDEVSYAYHDASHGPRIGRDGVAPRALLAAALGDAGARRLFWREQRAHPTGATGGLEFTQPAIAATLAQACVTDAARAGASWLVADEPVDLHQLRGQATGVEVVSLYELLANRLAR